MFEVLKIHNNVLKGILDTLKESQLVSPKDSEERKRYLSEVTRGLNSYLELKGIVDQMNKRIDTIQAITLTLLGAILACLIKIVFWGI